MSVEWHFYKEVVDVSDWQKIEEYVRQQGYTPKHLPWRQYIATICLHYEGDMEDEERDIPIDEWLEELHMNYLLSDFDYD